MSTAENPHDAALGASRGRSALASHVAAFDAGDNLVSVHGIAQLVRRNEEVAIEIRPGRLWNHEAVAIAMRDQPTDQQTRIARRRFRSDTRTIVGFCAIAPRLGLYACQAVLAAAYFFYHAPAFQP
jgi:hypothetical protein